jgi:hypothetical protein
MDEEENDIGGNQTLFVDCVLYFMRRHLIKSSTTVEPIRVKQLLTEAECFSY